MPQKDLHSLNRRPKLRGSSNVRISSILEVRLPIDAICMMEDVKFTGKRNDKGQKAL